MDIDQAQLEPYDHELLTLSREIYTTRSKFLKKFESRFGKLYNKLSNKLEWVEVVDESSWQKRGIEDKYHQTIKRDLILHMTKERNDEKNHWVLDDNCIRAEFAPGRSRPG